MQEALTDLGLSSKEAAVYLSLLQDGNVTAAQLATQLKEKRTTIYMMLDRLASMGLVAVDDKLPVKRYSAANPSQLALLIQQKQEAIRRDQQTLRSILPKLQAIHQFSNHRPGVTYFEGIEGYTAFQKAIARSDPPIDIFASNVAPENKAAFDVLQQEVGVRNKRRSKARIIFHTDARTWLDVAAYQRNGYEVRFWGKEPLVGEFIIFGNKVGLTSYLPEVVTTVVSNDVIAQTFGVIFEQIWCEAATS